VIAIWQFWRQRPPKSKTPIAGQSPDNVEVRRVELSENHAAIVFQRPGGSFGYYFVIRDVDEFGERWIEGYNPGSAYATVDLAEKYARMDAGQPFTGSGHH